MAEITASMVKELRERTDAPMMECKKALAEAGGDMAKAEEILRVKLGNKASKAASRVAAEGIVGVSVSADGKLATMVEVNCETDFVAKNDDFIAFARSLAQLVAARTPADVGAALRPAARRGHGRDDADGAGGQDRREHVDPPLRARAGQGAHRQLRARRCKIGVLVDVTGGDAELGKDLAMHIAASKPKALDASGVAAEAIETERRVAAEKAAEDAAKSGKSIPPEILAKRVDGTVQKFLKEVTLLGQPFVKDDKLSIEQLLKGKDAKVEQFVLYVVGEGIEKKSSDFAAEVAAQAAAARG